MKRICIILALMLIFVLPIIASAEGPVVKSPEADVVPLSVDPEKMDLNNGSFNIGLRDFDKIKEEGFLTVDLYVEEHYSREQITSLAPGNTFRMNGKVWTVGEIIIHEGEEGEADSYEIYPVEEYWGYIAFWPQQDGTFLGVMDDWSPVIHVGEKKIMLPLPDRFAFYTYSAGERDQPMDFTGMVVYLETYGNDIVPYNTVGVFEDGVLVEISHSSYPMGPEQTGDE